MNEFYIFANNHPVCATILGLGFMGLSAFAIYCNNPMKCELFEIGYRYDNLIEQE